MLHNFETIFRPEATKHPGYIDVKMLKLRTALQGSAPEGLNYRFSLTYQSEELRQKWVASAEHQRVWPTIENTLSSKNYTVLVVRRRLTRSFDSLNGSEPRRSDPNPERWSFWAWT